MKLFAFINCNNERKTNMLIDLPPMGISMAKSYGTNISQETVCSFADKAYELGLGNAGFEYIIIGDAWCNKTRTDGKLTENKEKFPNGLKYVSDYLHSKGFKLGITTSVGSLTPNGYPGSFEYEYPDAEVFAQLGVDYINHVYCDMPSRGGFLTPVRRMGMALRATQKNIFYALRFDYDNAQKHTYYTGYEWDGMDDSEYKGGYELERWLRGTGVNSFCMKDYNDDNFNVTLNDKFIGLTGSQCWLSLGDIVIRGKNCEWLKQAVAGCAIKCSPLIIDANIDELCECQIKVLTNSDCIKILKDEESRVPAILPCDNGQVYSKLLCNREYALQFVNTSNEDSNITFYTYDFGLVYNCGLKCDMYDVYSGEKIDLYTDVVKIPVAAGTSKLFIMKLV